MGKANRDRRRAKLKDRERQRKRRDFSWERGRPGPEPMHARGRAGERAGDAGGWRPSPAELAEYLVAASLTAQFNGDQAEFATCTAWLAGDIVRAAPSGSALTGAAGVSSVPGWRRIVSRQLWLALLPAVTAGWQQGWQPAEMIRQAERQFTPRHARLATDAVAAEMRTYAAATVDDRWTAQLAALGAVTWWDGDASYFEQWSVRERLDRAGTITCALETLFAFSALPEMSPLCPLPGAARRGTLTTEHPPGRKVDQRMLDRVRALLAKAESTEFPEEAEALTSRAQELMARHSIDDALLAAAADRAGRTGPGQADGRRLFVDSPYEAAKAVLVSVIAKANRCRSIWHKNLGLCTVLGFPADLDGVELLFTSLLVQATTAMVAAGSRQDACGRSRTRSFRQSFLAAYAQRIGERLCEATGAAERQAVADTPGANLLPVLAARNRVVDEAFDAMFPDMTTFSAGSVNDREGWITGRAAADLATLHDRRAVTGDAA